MSSLKIQQEQLNSRFEGILANINYNDNPWPEIQNILATMPDYIRLPDEILQSQQALVFSICDDAS